jgi:hypothetical protein
MEYNCNICNYNTNDSSNYKKHLSSKKHQKYSLNKSNKDNKNIADHSLNIADHSLNIADHSLNIAKKKNYTCNICGLELRHQSSYSRHKNKKIDCCDLTYEEKCKEKFDFTLVDKSVEGSLLDDS